jgi:hypothetical protein
MQMSAKKFYRRRRVTVFWGNVTDVVYETTSITQIVQGVSHSESRKFREPNFVGGNGTYRRGLPEVYRHLFLYVKIAGYGKQKVDVREPALDVNGRERITERLVQQLKDKCLGKRMRFLGTNHAFEIYDPGNLRL